MRMRRAWASAVLLLGALTAAAWWAARSGRTPTESAPFPAAACAPAAYPADAEARAARVQEPRLCFAAAETLPPELPWQTGEAEPDIGDPAAVKGGCLRLSNAGPYPANVLAFGSPTPQFFHTDLYAATEVPLVARHPETGHDIPGTAAQWAVQGDRVYFRLDPAARYSNGRPVRAGDYVLGALLRAECGDAGFEQLRAAASALEAYDEHTLVLTLRHPAVAASEAAALLHAAEPAFYAEFGSDYRERYAQRVAPTTGGYTLGRTERGRMAELVRVRDWWARDKRYYRYTCNVDTAEHHFLTDEAQAWEFLRRGKLDWLQTRRVSEWQQRRQEAEEQGLAAEVLRADYPVPLYGVALNAEQLPDAALRRGLLRAMDMDRALHLLFCGEAERLPTFHTGYGELSPAETPRVRYDPAAARAAFAEAGYDGAGEDGILCKANGERLSVRFTYPPSAALGTMAAVLAESARRCGAELVSEPLAWQISARRQQEGRYQLLYWASPAPPVPDPARFLSSRASGYEAPFRLHDAAMDAAVARYESALSPAERAAALAAIDRRVAELDIWLPAQQENRLYLLHSPRVRLPKGVVPRRYEAAQEHLLWIEPAP